MSKKSVEPDMTMKGKVCVLTGTTVGVGSVIAAALAKRRATVIMLNRDTRASERLERDLEVYAVSTSIKSIPFSPESWLSVSQAADKVLADYETVDLIVNNGQTFFPGSRKTADGVDMATRSNFLAHMQLTTRLMDRLRFSGGRVVTLAGPLRNFSSVVPTDSSTAIPKGYQAFLLSQARLLVFSLELARRFGSDASAVTVNPGPVKTDPTGGMPWVTRFGKFLRSQAPSEAARTAIAVAALEEGKSGELLGGRGAIEIPSRLASPELGSRLWDWGEQVLRQEEATSAATPPPKAR